MRAPEINSFLKKTLLTGFGGVGFFSFIVTILMLVMPIYMMTVISKVLTSQSEASLWGLTGIALFLLVILGVVIGIRGRVLNRIGSEFDKDIGKPLFKAMILKNCSDGHSASILNSLDSVKRFLRNEAIAAFFDVPFVPIFLLVIWALHPALGMVAVGSTILIAILSVVTDRRAKGKLAEAEPMHAQATARGSQYARQAEVLKAHGMIDVAADRWWNSRSKADELDLPGQDGLNDAQGVLKASMFFFPVILLCVGAFLVMDGVIGVGSMIAGNILMMRTVAPVQMALSGWKQFVEARSSLYQLDRFLGDHAQFQTHVQSTLPEPKVEVLVEGLVSRPPAKGVKPILNGFTFKVLPGETVGVIGASGAGKSTLLKHLVGLQIPLKGHCKFDQVPAWQWDPAVLGEYVGYMGQDSELFEGTVAQNISRFVDCDSAEVTKAAEVAGVHHRIASLVNGYDTYISADKVNLSGGEKQAVALARTVFRMPKLVVLDEPAASMDSKGQEAVKFCIQQLRAAGTTVFVSSHQTPLLNGLDKLLFIQFGKQIAFGAPDDVIPKIRKAG